MSIKTSFSETEDLTINTNNIELEIKWHRDSLEDQNARINTCMERLRSEEKKSKRRKAAAEIFMWICTAICIVCAMITLSLNTSSAIESQHIENVQHIIYMTIGVQILFSIVYLTFSRKDNKKSYTVFCEFFKEICLKNICEVSKIQRKGHCHIVLEEVDNPKYLDKDEYITAHYSVIYLADSENKEDQEEERTFLVNTLEESGDTEKAVLYITENEVKLQIPKSR